MKQIVSLVIYIFIVLLIGCQTETGESEPVSSTMQTSYYHIVFYNTLTDASVDIAVPTTQNFTLPDCTDDRIRFEIPDGRPFIEWNISSDGIDTHYKAGDIFPKQKKNSVTVLYAIFKEPAAVFYYVEYNINGGTGGSMTRSTFAVGKSYQLPKCTFKAPTGKRFDKWTTNADGTGKSYTDEQSMTNLATAAGSIVTLYAQWKVKTDLYITYHDPKNADNSDNPTTFLKTDNVTLTGLAGITGYTFGGWYDNETCTGSAITGWSAGDKDDDIELWAKWTANEYAVTFNKNAEDAVGTMAAQNMTYDTETALTANGYSLTGHRFLGWHTDKGASSAKYTNEQTVKNLTAINGGSVTLYAIWEEADTYTIAFAANGGTLTMDSVTVVVDEDYVLPKCAFKAPLGKIFEKWSDGKGSFYDNMATVRGLAEKDQTITLTAQWKDKDFYVIVLNDELHPSTADLTFDAGDYPALPTPSETGWTFDGWWTAADGGEEITSWTTNDDTELYAHWTHNLISYTFLLYGGKWDDDTDLPKTVSGYYGEAVSVPADPTRAGWTFAGWNGAVDGRPTTFGESSQAFAAQWTLPYTVVFNANGGTGSMSNQDMVYGEAAQLSANAFTRSGWTFYGWDTSSDGGGTLYQDRQSVSNLTDKANGTVRLYALWQTSTPAVGHICYDNGGSKIYSDKYLSDKTVLGVVFAVGTKVKIIYPDQEDSCAWAGSSDTIACTNEDDGSVNTSKVPTSVAYWPFHWVYGCGDGWYLPAINELIAIYNVDDTINPVLTLLHNAGISAAEFYGNYWSSTTDASQSHKYAYYLQGGGKGTELKTRQSAKVRAVMAF
ncbi:MAG: InlB B-repeat-containing protein [Spirochaetales bacterium]|nr:InlB B-repeat-containing protein [Spirochaetales bacterium]